MILHPPAEVEKGPSPPDSWSITSLRPGGSARITSAADGAGLLSLHSDNVGHVGLSADKLTGCISPRQFFSEEPKTLVQLVGTLCTSPVKNSTSGPL